MAFLHEKSMWFSLFLLLVSTRFTCGDIYQVGDEKGWTMNDKTDYTAWEKSKKFQVGDELLFQYNNQNHNVLQVNKEGYHKCNTAAPIAVFNTGHDSIIINSDEEHLYFICGTPGHCKAGQKLSIKVSKTKSSVKPPPSFAEPPPESEANIARGGLCGFLLSIAILFFTFDV